MPSCSRRQIKLFATDRAVLTEAIVAVNAAHTDAGQTADRCGTKKGKRNCGGMGAFERDKKSKSNWQFAG